MNGPHNDPSLRAEDCYVLGYVARAHGLKGALKVVLDVQDALVYAELKTVWLQLEGKPLMRASIQSLQLQPNGPAIVQFVGIQNLEDAEPWLGATLLLPLSLLPPPATGSFYYFEVPGFAALDSAGKPIGIILEVVEMPAQDLLRIAHPSGKEVLVPLRPEFMGKLDRSTRTLQLHLPDGLLEVYLDDAAANSDAEAE